MCQTQTFFCCFFFSVLCVLVNQSADRRKRWQKSQKNDKQTKTRKTNETSQASLPSLSSQVFLHQKWCRIAVVVTTNFVRGYVRQQSGCFKVMKNQWPNIHFSCSIFCLHSNGSFECGGYLHLFQMCFWPVNWITASVTERTDTHHNHAA